MATVLIGLTGGIASGKSTVSRHLRALGIPVIDADEIAREVVEVGSDGLRAVVEAFSEEILQEDGSLDRKALGARVFANAEERAKLNAILHPRIGMRTAQRMQALRAQNVPEIVYDVPLMVENGLHRGVDILVVVAVSPETQRERLMQRDSLTREEAQARMDAQLPLADKVAVADVVIDNNGTIEETLQQVDTFLESVRQGRA